LRLIDRSLGALSPLATLERGYAIVTRSSDGELVSSSTAAGKGTEIDVRLAEGALSATVNSTSRSE
jgi:exodeoxyribonuclease VII large subunit